jgi:hypothetical protein
MVDYRGDLIVGGKFNYAGGSTTPYRADNIARWDGTTWHRLGSGVNGTVRSMCVFNDELVVSGNFTVAGGRPIQYIARWNGTTWNSMGQIDSDAEPLVIYNDELVATGFNTADGHAVPRIARWNGSAWLGFGTQSLDYGSGLLVFRDSLYAEVIHNVGGFDYPLLSKWDGASWHPLGEGLDSWLGAVITLEEYNGALVAGGRFRETLSLGNIARWDGSRWLPFGSGVSPGRGENGAVTDLAVYNASLYLTGSFIAAGNKPSWFIARWDDVITGFVSKPSTPPGRTTLSISPGDSLVRHCRISRLCTSSAPRNPPDRSWSWP